MCPWHGISRRTNGGKVGKKKKKVINYEITVVGWPVLWWRVTADGFDSFILLLASGSVGAERSTGPWQNLTEGGWRVTDGMTGWEQGWHTPHSGCCCHSLLNLCVASMHIKGIFLASWWIYGYLLFYFFSACLCQKKLYLSSSSHITSRLWAALTGWLCGAPPAVTLSLSIRRKAVSKSSSSGFMNQNLSPVDHQGWQRVLTNNKTQRIT